MEICGDVALAGVLAVCRSLRRLPVTTAFVAFRHPIVRVVGNDDAHEHQQEDQHVTPACRHYHVLETLFRTTFIISIKVLLRVCLPRSSSHEGNKQFRVNPLRVHLLRQLLNPN